MLLFHNEGKPFNRRYEMPAILEALEAQLNDLNADVRKEAFEQLLAMAAKGDVVLPEPGACVNLHCHTSFSFNGYGYSPAYIAWKARREGLLMAGIVDFDVLDAVDEFLDACRRVGIRGCAGIETRVFVPSFDTREINSPGEPGVSYHMGVGFVRGEVPDKALLAGFLKMAQDRNRGVAERVNAYLAPVCVDYERDVLPLTPNGNATERHLCMAYDIKAQEVLPDAEARASFWAEKLKTDMGKIREILQDAPTLQGLIRAKTMKSGGVGYVKASGPDFPGLDRMNAFVLEAGAIPTFAWLDGTTAGEMAIEELLDTMMSGGVAAVNIIPDRNWNIKDPAAKKTKVDNLYRFVELAQSRDLPIAVGTEMNAYGNKFVDTFDAPELKPLVPSFVDGAFIFYGHTLLQAHAGMGYLSDWAKKHFASTKQKNAFFKHIGEVVAPARMDILNGIAPHMSPEDIATAKCPKHA